MRMRFTFSLHGTTLGKAMFACLSKPFQTGLYHNCLSITIAMHFIRNLKFFIFVFYNICRCFCHKKTIDMGYICSVCLSIFCKHHKKCSTCGYVQIITISINAIMTELIFAFRSVFGQAPMENVSAASDRKRKAL